MRGVEGGEGLDGEGQPDQAEQPAHPLGAGPFLASRTSAMATSTTVAAQVTVTTHRAPSAAGAPFGRPTGGPTESMVPPHPAPGFNANPARFPKDHPMGVTRPSCHGTGSGSEEPLAVAVVLSLNVVPEPRQHPADHRIATGAPTRAPQWIPVGGQRVVAKPAPLLEGCRIQPNRHPRGTCRRCIHVSRAECVDG